MREVITASDGYILTDGEIYGTTIYLAEGADASTFHEITMEEYNAKMAEEAAEGGGLDTETIEKAQAYDILMGVSE